MEPPRCCVHREHRIWGVPLLQPPRCGNSARFNPPDALFTVNTASGGFRTPSPGGFTSAVLNQYVNPPFRKTAVSQNHHFYLGDFRKPAVSQNRRFANPPCQKPTVSDLLTVFCSTMFCKFSGPVLGGRLLLDNFCLTVFVGRQYITEHISYK